MARPRRILVLLLALLAAGMLLGACGEDEDEEAPPQGNPAARVGQAAAGRLEAIERMRASLTAVSDLTAAGRRVDAGPHLDSAGTAWREIEGDVRADDAILAREIGAALEAIGEELQAGTTFDALRDRVAPLGSQLLDGAAQALLGTEARRDAGLKAEVLDRLAEDLQNGVYGASGGDASRSGGEEAEAWGLLLRSQALAREIVAELGPKRDPVVNGLKSIRELFPEGAASPPLRDVAELERRAARVRAALGERFELR